MKHLMKANIAVGLHLLLLPMPAQAENATSSLAALVRITCSRGGEATSPGSGFVVRIENDSATIVTASHVVEGAQCEVEFANAANRVPVERALGIEVGEDHGLAALRVRGVPAGVETLELDSDSRVGLGDALLLAGFPQMARNPRVKQGVFSGSEGKLILIDRAAGEGASGGPVLSGGKAVGVITAGGVGEEYTYAVNAVVARAILTGWGIDLGENAPEPLPIGPPPVSKGGAHLGAAPARSSNIAVAIANARGRAIRTLRAISPPGSAGQSARRL